MKNYILIFITFCISLITLSSACQDTTPDYSELKTQYEKKLSLYLKKTNDVYNHVSISSQGISIYDSLPSQMVDSAEFFLHWSDLIGYQHLLQTKPLEAFNAYMNDADWKNIQYQDDKPWSWNDTIDKPLMGLKIALDPGHIAGDFEEGIFEGKFVKMKIDGREIKIFESYLNWWTIQVLKENLEGLGAQTIITRNAMGHTAFDKTYSQWYIECDSVPKPKKRRFFFSYFRHEDNTERVRKINEFEPDLTFIAHYNVDANNTNWNKPTSANNSMAFVGGAYMDGELLEKDRRFNFLRLLLSNDIENSVSLSKKVLKNLQINTGVKPIPVDNDQSYLERSSLLTTSQGIYARNLSLSGRVFGTLCFMEPMYQDNEKEVLLLSKRDYDFNGEMIPNRVIEVADAYLLGILEYLKTDY